MVWYSDVYKEIVRWCHYHYQDNLVGLAFYDPAATNQEFPRGDINLLLLLRTAPADARERYDAKTEVVLRNLAPSHKFVCRIQTVSEIEALAELKLPLLEIYLREVDIVYDPQGILQATRTTLNADCLQS